MSFVRNGPLTPHPYFVPSLQRKTMLVAREGGGGEEGVRVREICDLRFEVTHSKDKGRKWLAGLGEVEGTGGKWGMD